jgi:hypothetical protein
MNRGDYGTFLYLVAEKMKSHEFDESYFNILIDNIMILTMINVRNKLQHGVNILSVKRNDLL